MDVQLLEAQERVTPQWNNTVSCIDMVRPTSRRPVVGSNSLVIGGPMIPQTTAYSFARAPNGGVLTGFVAR